MSARYIHNAGNGDISDCRQFFLYAFSGQDRSICNRDKYDMRTRTEGGIHSNDKWISTGHAAEMRSSIPTGCSKIFLDEFEQRINPYDTLESVERTRYHTKEELERREAFAHLDKLIPCKENALCLRK